MAELINEQDSLNKGRVKINESILASERAEQNSTEAVNTANEAKVQSDNTQTQLDTIVINGDSSVEAAQARVDENGHAYSTLKSRLDSEHRDVTEKLLFAEGEILSVKNRVPEHFGNINLVEHPLANNPVLTKNDVTDIDAKFVADAFRAYDNGTHYLFFEVADQDDVGHIAYATSVDAINWSYGGIILTGGGHWAYPFVFKYEDEWYMLPDRGGSVPGLTLYRATNFPTTWVEDTIFFTTGAHIDATPFEWKGKWYLVDYNGSQVNLYYADSIKSTEWALHPSSPILTGSQIRPGGRPIVNEDNIQFFIQDGSNGIYGEKLLTYIISELTPNNVSMYPIEKPILHAANNGLWNSRGMHTLDLDLTNRGSLPVAIVDGRAQDYSWGIGVYTVGVNRQKPYLRAVLNTDQSIPHETWTKVRFDSVLADTHKTFNLSESKYTVPESGLYKLDISTCLTAVNVTNNQFTINLRVLRNGAEDRSSPNLGIGTSISIRQTFSLNDIFVLHKGDILEVEFYQSSGSSRNLLRQGWATWFSLVKVE